jgi:hypothetical protein
VTPSVTRDTEAEAEAETQASTTLNLLFGTLKTVPRTRRYNKSHAQLPTAKSHANDETDL